MKTQSIENEEGLNRKFELLTSKSKQHENSLIKSISELIDKKFSKHLLKSSSKNSLKLNDEIDIEVYNIFQNEELEKLKKNKKKVEDILKHSRLNLLSLEDKENVEILKKMITNGGLMEKIRTVWNNGGGNAFNTMVFNMHIERITSDLNDKIRNLDS
jgi:hypothetical protein